MMIAFTIARHAPPNAYTFARAKRREDGAAFFLRVDRCLAVSLVGRQVNERTGVASASLRFPPCAQWVARLARARRTLVSPGRLSRPAPVTSRRFNYHAGLAMRFANSLLPGARGSTAR